MTGENDLMRRDDVGKIKGRLFGNIAMVMGLEVDINRIENPRLVKAISGFMNPEPWHTEIYYRDHFDHTDRYHHRDVYH